MQRQLPLVRLYLLAFYHLYYFCLLRFYSLFYLRNLIFPLDYWRRLFFSILHAPFLDARSQCGQVLAHDVGRGQLDEKFRSDQ